MATLGPGVRLQVSAEWQRRLSSEKQVCAFTKPQLAAAIAAIDQWIEDNAASFNAALPAAFAAGATAAQKADLLAFVLMRRANRLELT